MQDVIMLTTTKVTNSSLNATSMKPCQIPTILRNRKNDMGPAQIVNLH